MYMLDKLKLEVSNIIEKCFLCSASPKGGLLWAAGSANFSHCINCHSNYKFN